MVMAAKYPGKCRKCGGQIYVGDQIEWSKEDGARHATKCPAESQTINTKPKRSSGPTRRCWECGCRFTYSECKQRDGDWQDNYCGC